MKKQLNGFTDTLKTAIQGNQLNGIWKKLFGTWSEIGGKRLRQLILHLRLWKWAAVKHPDFKHFEIGFSKILHITAEYSHYSGEFFVLRISLYKPIFYTFIPMVAVSEFLKTHDLPQDTIYEDVPF